MSVGDHFTAVVAIAKADGVYDEGISDITGQRMSIVKRETLLTDPKSKAVIELLTIKHDTG